MQKRSAFARGTVWALAMQFSVPLRIALVCPALIAAAAWLWGLYLPSRSPGLMQIIIILFLCGFTALLSVTVAATRLVRDRSMRLPQNVICLSVAAVPATLFITWYSAALYG